MVTPSCRTPGSALIADAISSASGRTSGSPPVSRTFDTPADTNSLASRTTSSADSVASSGVSSTPSSGMQYWHRRLHRSVSEIRR